MVPFGGWSMPVQYVGIGQEHAAVRERSGLFDVSHMLGCVVRGARREHDLGAQEAHQLTAFDGEAVRHGNDQRVAFRGADHGESDSGVAARRLDDRLARLQVTAAFRLFDDADREPVFHRCGGVEEL